MIINLLAYISFYSNVSLYWIEYNSCLTGRSNDTVVVAVDISFLIDCA